MRTDVGVAAPGLPLLVVKGAEERAVQLRLLARARLRIVNGAGGREVLGRGTWARARPPADRSPRVRQQGRREAANGLKFLVMLRVMQAT